MTRRPTALIAFLFVATFAAPARAEPVLLRYGAAYSTLRSIYALPIVVADARASSNAKDWISKSSCRFPAAPTK